MVPGRLTTSPKPEDAHDNEHLICRFHCIMTDACCLHLVAVRSSLPRLQTWGGAARGVDSTLYTYDGVIITRQLIHYRNASSGQVKTSLVANDLEGTTLRETAQAQVKLRKGCNIHGTNESSFGYKTID